MDITLTITMLPVSEGLPSGPHQVLFLHPEYGVRAGRFQSRVNEWLSDDLRFRGESITHWCELPVVPAGSLAR